MRQEYNSVLSTPIEADTDILVKPKYRLIYLPRYIGQSVVLILQQNMCRYSNLCA